MTSAEKLRLCLLAVLVGSFIGQFFTPPAMAEKKEGVEATIDVQASPQKCFETIVGQRTAEPAKRRVISQDGNRTVLEEKFTGLPVIGDAYMQYEEIATPYSSLVAHLIKSDKFKAFESRWTLTATADAKGTSIRLYTYLNTGLWLPFAQQLTNRQTHQDITARLGLIKRLAEGGQ
ncbi:MAG TPA: hypothetical protein V6D08_14725 [Candidatus Obscuribacterales bacterium]